MKVTHQPASSLASRVLYTRDIDWRQLQFIQQETFKDLSPEAKQKLKTSILANEFTQPFYVWHEESTDTFYCLDGFHRVKVLAELVEEGVKVPEMLPGTFIECVDKKEAARLVLVYSSMYAKITQQGLFDFLTEYDIQFAVVRDQLDIPDFSDSRFEQKYDLFNVCADTDEYEVDIDSPGQTLVQPGDLFEINGHRIACGSFMDNSLRHALMQDKLARILICDPPYNIPASLFTSKHEDFVMAAGEMQDDEFVGFLSKVMLCGIEHTVPGAVHFIFMDWRHCWHITEAGRRSYGSPQPKQMCVWVKDSFANGSFYRAQQELCFIFSNRSAKFLWNKDMLDQGGFYKDNDELVFIFKNGEAKHLSHLDLADRIRSNVWKYPSATSMKNPDRYQLANHPTPKPVAMIADAILDTTNPGEIIIDWFLGSGTALIGAQKTGRLCYGTEIEPRFVQSIIKRYVLYCEKNNLGIKFSHLNGNLTLNQFTHESVLQ